MLSGDLEVLETSLSFRLEEGAEGLETLELKGRRFWDFGAEVLRVRRVGGILMVGFV